MVAICFYFQVHQPFRMKQYSVFDIGTHSTYFDEQKNREIALKVAKKCYLPMNALLLQLIERHKGAFRVSFSISGVALEQFSLYCPEVIRSFQALAKTGCVEFISETYYHSLSVLYSKQEFKEQVDQHKKLIQSLFGVTPTTFRNTELIYNNEIANIVEHMGYTAILAEGVDNILGWRSCNFLYTPHTCKTIKLLLKNYRLSDDIAFRFSNKGWEEYPLTIEKYIHWINAVNGNGDVINLFMDYETFGEHQWEDTGIFSFMEVLPEYVLRHPDNCFMTPSQVAQAFPVRDVLDIHHTISWADMERDLSAWLGNKIQHNAINELYAIEQLVKQKQDKQLLDDWKKLTTSDHFYYMCTKWFADGDVHKYFNPYDSPYDSYIAFMNIINDMVLRCRTKPQMVDQTNNHTQPEVEYGHVVIENQVDQVKHL
ncbi:MAG: glycoside hydrolase family 57 protein [Candidatus Woesearchaeota archaeon]